MRVVVMKQSSLMTPHLKELQKPLREDRNQLSGLILLGQEATDLTPVKASP